MRVALLTMSILAFSAQIATARPISYPGGITLMTMNDTDSNALHTLYTVTPNYSVGVNLEYLRDSEAKMATVEGNYLLKRWNNSDSQANVYVTAGGGAAEANGETNPAAYAAIEADWEDRRFFTQYQNRLLWAEDTEQSVKHKARVGIAPYIGNSGDLHTWLMLEADYDAGKDDSFSLTPLVRLFKGTALVEAGYNLDGGILFNATYNF